MEKFCLKWNDFKANVSSSFNVLRKEEELFDVTLVSDDEHHIAAHKLILSVSSDFFKNIIRKSNHSNPLIFLSGVTSKELYRIMDYIYEGEVQLLQDDLDSFLEIANKLKIGGLYGALAENEGDEKTEEPKFEYDMNCSKDFIEDVIESNQKARTRTKTTDRTIAISVQENDSMYTEAKQAVDEIVTKDGDIWLCKTCGKTTKTSGQIRLHAEIHIEGLSFPCLLCDSTFRSRKSLCDHKYHKHK